MIDQVSDEALGRQQMFGLAVDCQFVCCSGKHIDEEKWLASSNYAHVPPRIIRKIVSLVKNLHANPFIYQNWRELAETIGYENFISFCNIRVTMLRKQRALAH